MLQAVYLPLMACLTHFILETMKVLSICSHYTSLSSSTSVFIPTGYIYICNHIYIFKSGEESVICMCLYIGQFTSFKEQEDPSTGIFFFFFEQDIHSHTHTHTSTHMHT